MEILLKVSRIGLVTGIALLIVGILLTVGPKVPIPDMDSPEPQATACLLAGTLLIWLGCLGLALALGPLRTALAGAASIVLSLLLPWLLHTVGVVWWSRLLGVPVWAFFFVGCTLLGIAAARFAIRRASQASVAALSRLGIRKPDLFQKAALTGLLLGVPLFLFLISRHAPPLFRSPSQLSFIYIRSSTVDFDWDATHGFTAFKVGNTRSTGGLVWQRLVILQIKPRLDSFLRLSQQPRVKGWGGVRVLEVIPLAFPGCWGCDDMDFEDLHETELMRAAMKGDLALVRKLIAEGANLNARNREGKTALTLAERYGSLEIAEALKKAGAKP